MKRILSLVMMFILPLAGNADILLNAGESFVFSFGTNDFVYEAASGSEEWGFDIRGPIFSERIFTINLYQDSLADSPIYTQSVTNSPSLFPVGYFISLFAFNVSENKFDEIWDDAQGMIELELHQGSMNISEVFAATIINDQYFVASIPEPNSVAFLLVGSGIFYLRKNKNSQPESRAYSIERRLLRAKRT